MGQKATKSGYVIGTALEGAGEGDAKILVAIGAKQAFIALSTKGNLLETVKAGAFIAHFDAFGQLAVCVGVYNGGGGVYIRILVLRASGEERSGGYRAQSVGRADDSVGCDFEFTVNWRDYGLGIGSGLFNSGTIELNSKL